MPMKTLYHYVHCPFCIRVRMALGLFQIEYESKVLSYDDEQTPLQLCQKKMLPIWSDDTATLNESLDIIRHLDSNNEFGEQLQNEEQKKKLEEVLSEISGPLFKLCMPYFVWTPEFDEKSRAYFLKKKEAKRGPFHELLKQKKRHEEDLNELLENKIASKLAPYYQSSQFGLWDILIAAHLWGLYLVPEYRLSEPLHRYLQDIKKITKFDYFSDYTQEVFWHERV